MLIGIVGIGFVGHALQKSFLKKSQEDRELWIYSYDKYKNIGFFDDILDVDIVFLCLPTLYDDKLGSYDKSAIHETCEKLAEEKYKGLIVIKSTVEPGTTQELADKYNLHFVHNPEFLTARTADEDFHNQKHIIIGKTKQVPDEQTDLLAGFYKKYYPSSDISICSSTESESVKIFCNSFYAVKVQFFNELYIFCQKMGIEYQTVKDTMLKNNWIHPMHTDVPGPDGLLSYGGCCFPKDTNALLSFMKQIETSCGVLEATVQERNLMRKDN